MPGYSLKTTGVVAMLIAMSLASHCNGTGRVYTLGGCTWEKETGSVQQRNGSLVLDGVAGKTELQSPLQSKNLRCEFILEFHRGLRDSSVGLETWAPDEYSITFRGGNVKIVAGGEPKTVSPVESYIGKKITVSLEASENRLFAKINGEVLIDEKNVYWKDRILKPRLNADSGDMITLYSCSCSVVSP